MSEFLSSFLQLKRDAVFDETEDGYERLAESISKNSLETDHSSKSNKCRILKTLIHGGCAYDCAYCRVCKNKNPASVSPKDLAEYFLKQNRDNVYDGIFVSSGILGDTDSIMHDIIETGERIRKGGFGGYIHLKILPGASRTDIRAAADIATRISLNIETTSKSHMSEISCVKDYTCDISKRLDWIASEAPGRHTTQVVVGAADESDKEIIECIKGLYRKVKPARVYFSPFRAQKNTPLELKENTRQWRANRLYQTDYLIRKYNFSPDEFYQVLDDNDLLENIDPKIKLAETKGRTDINTAGLYELMRIPGIGRKKALKICGERKHKTLNPNDLSKLNIPKKRAMPYITFEKDGYQSRISDFRDA